MDPVIETRQPLHSAAGNGSDQWSTLLSRMLEDLSRIIRLELELLEARVAPSVVAFGDRLIAGLVLVCASAVAGCCLLAALILLLHQWMPWWQSFGIGGLVTITCGLIVYVSLKSSEAPAKSQEQPRAHIPVAEGAGSER